MIIIVLLIITTTTDSSLDSKMYISILYNIINCHARVFYEKNKQKTNERTNLDLLNIPRLWGGKSNTEYTGSLGYNSVFRVCYITSIIDDVVCRRDPGYVQYHRNNYMLSQVVHIKRRLDNLGIQTNVVRWDQRLHTELLHGIGSTVYIYYSDLNRHVSTQEKPNQRQYITPSSIIVVLYRWPDNN